MKNFTFVPTETIRKEGLPKSVKSAASDLFTSDVSEREKKNPGVFYNLWSKPQQTEKVSRSRKTPVVIPVNQTTARFSDRSVNGMNEGKDGAQILRSASKKSAQSGSISKSKQGEKLLLFDFVMPVPSSGVSPSAAVKSGTKVGPEQMVNKIIQAALNNSAVQKQLIDPQAKLLKVNFNFQTNSAATNDAKSLNAMPSKSGSLILKNITGLMWQPVESARELEQLGKQFNLSTIREINATLKPLEGNLLKISLESARQNFKKSKQKNQPVGRVNDSSLSDFTATDLKKTVENNSVPENKNNALQLLLKVEAREVPQQNTLPEALAHSLQQKLTTSEGNQPFEQKLLNIRIHLLSHPGPVAPPQLLSLPGQEPQNVSNMQLFINRIEELVDQAQSMKLRSGQIRMSMDDTPMGKLDLKFQQNERQLTVVVENEQIRNELLRLAPVIQQNLSEKGIVLNGFQVNVGQFGQSQQEKQSSKKANHSSGSIQTGKEGSAHESQSTVINRKFGYNTMEITV